MAKPEVSSSVTPNDDENIMCLQKGGWRNVYEGSQRRFREVAEQHDAVASTTYEDDTVHDEILSGVRLFLSGVEVRGQA